MIMYYSGGGAERYLNSVSVMYSYFNNVSQNGENLPDEKLRRLLKNKIKKDSLKTSSGSHFLDSGSFSHWRKAKKYAKKTGNSEWSYYDTKEFWGYVDRYAEFILEHKKGINHYANVDVIGNPELTWRTQQYLEGRGLSPVPVIHYKTDLRWMEKYIKTDYDFVALGGLVGNLNRSACREWTDLAFSTVCNTKNKLPRVKVHGFGVAMHSLLLRYPWWSVDSTSWVKYPAYGYVFIPKYRGGKFIFTESANAIMFWGDRTR